MWVELVGFHLALRVHKNTHHPSFIFVNEATSHFDVSELSDCCSFFLTIRNHLSFSFSFFIHGESSVCTAVEIQRQQRIRHLTLEDVAVAATRQEGLPGIASGLVLPAM